MNVLGKELWAQGGRSIKVKFIGTDHEGEHEGWGLTYLITWKDEYGWMSQRIKTCCRKLDKMNTAAC